MCNNYVGLLIVRILFCNTGHYICIEGEDLIENTMGAAEICKFTHIFHHC